MTELPPAAKVREFFLFTELLLFTKPRTTTRGKTTFEIRRLVPAAAGEHCHSAAPPFPLPY